VQGSRAGINRAPTQRDFHSFDQWTWAHELAESIRLQSALESRSGDRPLQARDWVTGQMLFAHCHRMRVSISHSDLIVRKGFLDRETKSAELKIECPTNGTWV
jgi:hypothetical protein